MNVNDRKMFRKRDARNKLNQLGGIMASSPELMQTAQGFQRGGSIYANQPSMITSIMDFLSTGDAGSGVGQIQEQNAMIRAGITPEDLQRVRAQVTPEDIARVNERTLMHRRATAGDVASQMQIPQGDKTAQIQNIESQLSDLGGLMTPQQQMSSQAGLERLIESQSEMMTYPDEALRSMRIGDRGELAPTEAEPEQPAVVEPVQPPQTSEELAADSQDNRAIVEAAKKGELGAAEQVKAVVQQGTPEEQEQSLASLMNEFKQNAPEYKGVDRGLAIAKIGFAMAAGQSPNAITNISKALNDGADMLIKDKRDRDAFDRQVQLSALQYGLGEIGKKRAQDRLDQRTFREYVADEDGIEYNGEIYNKGENILVSQADILANGGKIPSGLADKAVYAAGIKASGEKLKAFTDAVDKMKEEAVLSDTAATKISEQYGSAVSNFQSAEVGVQLLENAILDVAEGEVTGFANGFGAAMNKVSNAAGIQLDQKFESVDQFKATLRRAFQKLIPTTLGEAQSANSISNRDVEFLADAYINAGALQNGVFSLAFVDEDVLIGQLQGAIGEFRKSQRQALNQMTGLEGRLYGRTMPGTRAPASTLVDPYRQSMSPYMPGQTGTSTGLVKGDDGVFRFQ